MKSVYVILLVSILALAGCVHQKPQAPKTQEYFATLIKPDGTKQFSYTLIVAMPERKDAGGEHGGPGGHGAHERHGGEGSPGEHRGRNHKPKDDLMQDEFEHIFDNALNSKLNSTEFCRTSFHSLDRQSRPGAILVKGECNETATHADREKFPNPPPQKITEDVLE